MSHEALRVPVCQQADEPACPKPDQQWEDRRDDIEALIEAARGDQDDLFDRPSIGPAPKADVPGSESKRESVMARLGRLNSG